MLRLNRSQTSCEAHKNLNNIIPQLKTFRSHTFLDITHKHITKKFKIAPSVLKAKKLSIATLANFIYRLFMVDVLVGFTFLKCITH